MKRLILLLSIFFISITGFSQRYTIEASTNSGYFLVNDVDYAQGHFSVKYGGNVAVDTLRLFSLYNIYEGKNLITSRYYDEVVGVSSWDELTQLLAKHGVIRSGDVSVQDQTTPVIIASMSNEKGSTLLTDTAIVDSLKIIVNDTTGVAAGTYLSIFNITANRFYLANVLLADEDSVWLDTPIDFAYPAGSFVTFGNKNMNVDGSDSSIIYGLRNTDEQIGSEFDITSIIIHCQTGTTVDLSKFGDIVGGLTNGIVLRKVDGVQRNIFNTKTNGELSNLMYDFNIQAAQGNQQDGFTGRMTFGGQSKMGVVIRLRQGEDLQLIVQDSLSGLEILEIICLGHLVDY